jgi:hypothetical protein
MRGSFCRRPPRRSARRSDRVFALFSMERRAARRRMRSPWWRRCRATAASPHRGSWTSRDTRPDSSKWADGAAGSSFAASRIRRPPSPPRFVAARRSARSRRARPWRSGRAPPEDGCCIGIGQSAGFVEGVGELQPRSLSAAVIEFLIFRVSTKRNERGQRPHLQYRPDKLRAPHSAGLSIQKKRRRFAFAARLGRPLPRIALCAARV